MSNFFGGQFFGGGFFGQVTATPTGPVGGGGYLRFPRAPSEKKRRRDFYRRLGIELEDDEAAEVVALVAERQADDLHLDDLQRTEELARELQVRGLESDTRYFEALARERERLIEEEIGKLLRQKVRDEEEILMLLIATRLT